MVIRRATPFAVFLAWGLLVQGAARAADNLVFVPLVPCRVIDTRQPGAGGPLAANSNRTFFFRGPTRDYSTTPNQGGNSSGCGIPDLTSDASPFRNLAQALAINVVAVGAAGAGDLRAWAANHSAPNASIVNYAQQTALAGLNIANGVIVPMCDEVSPTACTSGDITFRADVSGTHLVVDVVGYFHAGSVATTDWDTALGVGALSATTSGKRDVALGYAALAANTGGSYDTAVGFKALSTNTVGISNTAVGAFSLPVADASYNTAVGVFALKSTTLGNHNTAIGKDASYLNTTGSYNTTLGYRAGANVPSGSSNIFIGAKAYGYVGDNNVLRIGNGLTKAYIAGVSGTPVAGNLVVVSGSGQLGTAGVSTLQTTRTIDIAGVAAQSCLNTLVTLTGAVPGSGCVVGEFFPDDGLVMSCWVSGANKVQLRACNVTAGLIDPDLKDYSIRVFSP